MTFAKLGGGGGTHAILPASSGDIPKRPLKVFVPPEVVPLNTNPKLTIEVSIEALPEMPVTAGHLGDPNSTSLIPSNGMGGPVGIGNKHGRGVGDHDGDSYGEGGPNGRAVVFGPGVTMPIAIRKVEPEFTEDARRARMQGTVRLYAEIGVDGKAHNIRVTRSIGLGLDEKAIEALTQWLFKPGTKDGKPLPVMANVDVSFHLL
jgi:TonB family protein